MLCLTRKVDESIRIGDAVITVLELRGKQVRIGIDAPKATPIIRTEVDNRPATLAEIRDAHDKGASA